MSQTIQLPDVPRFMHEAMNTTFAFYLDGSSPAAIRSLLRCCVEIIDDLEQKLSAFIDGSDVWRINRMAAGETLYLTDDCYECLCRALVGHQLTNGLFDVTLGSLIEHQKADPNSAAPAVQGQLVIDPDRPAIHCLQAGRRIDLGGIGKGYALDRLAEELKLRGASNALLCAGASSLLAFGSRAWPISLQGGTESFRFELLTSSLSTSGTAMQGAHIVHPKRHELAHPRVWVHAVDASTAEIFSTAGMLADPQELAAFVTQENGVQQIYHDTLNGIKKCSV